MHNLFLIYFVNLKEIDNKIYIKNQRDATWQYVY